MASQISEEELRRLTPEARIRKLRELEQQRLKKLEEERQKVENEISEGKRLIRQTEEQIDKGEEPEPPARKEEEIRKRDDTLERIVAEEEISEESKGEQYKTGAEYQTRPGREYDSSDQYRSGPPDELRRQTGQEYQAREERSPGGGAYLREERVESFLDKMYKR